jgi:hypothetical protein
LNLTQDGGRHSGKAAVERLLAAAGERKPAVIYMTGDLLEISELEGGLGEPRLLQKPFRVSDVLATLQDVFAASPPDPTPE